MLTLLMLPALFWSCVFAALAGAGPLERAIETAPDALQVLIVVACPLLACAIGLRVVRDESSAGAHVKRAGRLTFAAGAVLFVFAVVATLRVA
jgi:hypothetical protein